MSEPLSHDHIMQQMAILIYNQPAVQEALTAISRAHRVREGLTEAGVALVRAVADTAFAFAQDPESIAAAMEASPTTAAEARHKPGVYPAAAIQDGDTISHGLVDHVVTKVLAGRDEVQITLENGAVITVPPETGINLVKPNESTI